MERQSPKRAATPPPAQSSPKRAHSAASEAPTEVLPTAALPDGAAAPECAPSGGAAAEPVSRAPSPAVVDDHTDVDTDADDDPESKKAPFPRYTDADAPHLWCVEYTVLDSGDESMYRLIGDQRTFSTAELEALHYFRGYCHGNRDAYPAFVDSNLERRVYFARVHRVIQRLHGDYKVFEDEEKWPNSRFPADHVLQLTVKRPSMF